MAYLILANISLVVFFGIYVLVLKRLTFFQWNRVYLLSAVAISFLISLLQFVDLSHHKEVYQPLAVIDLGETESVISMNIAASSGWGSVMDWIRIVYAVGVGLMLLWFGVRLYRVLTVFGGNITVQRSFSFFNRVFLAKESKHSNMVEAHELIHVRQGHSYDLLLLEILRIFNWFNPLFYFYIKEVKFQHECIADEACAKDKVQYAELLVANAVNVSPSVLVHEFSNHSFLKRRIMMLFKSKSKKINRAKYLLILPTVLMVSGVALAFNVSIKNIIPIGAKDVENIIQQDTTKSKAAGAKGKIIRKEKPREGENGTTITDGTITPQEREEADDRVFTAVEVNPEPEGGLNAFRMWFGQNYPYPQAAIDAEIKGKVVVSFIVEKDGTFGDFKIVTDLGYGTGEAAIETLKKAEPWKPGVQNGRNVRVAYTMPFTLNLES